MNGRASRGQGFPIDRIESGGGDLQGGMESLSGIGDREMDEETRRKLDKLVLRGWKALVNRGDDENEFLEELKTVLGQLELLSDSTLRDASK